MVDANYATIRFVKASRNVVVEGDTIKWTVTLNLPAKWAKGALWMQFALFYNNGADAFDVKNVKFSNGVTYQNGVLHIPITVRQFYTTVHISNDKLREGTETVTARFGTFPSPVNIVNRFDTIVTKVTVKTPYVVEGQSAQWIVELDRKNINQYRKIPFSVIFSGGSNAKDLGQRQFSNGVKQDKLWLLIPPNVTSFTATIAVPEDTINERAEAFSVQFGTHKSSVSVEQLSTIKNGLVKDVDTKNNPSPEGQLRYFRVKLARVDPRNHQKITFKLSFGAFANADDLGRRQFTNGVTQYKNYLIVPPKVSVFDVVILVKNDAAFEIDEKVSAVFGNQTASFIIPRNDFTPQSATYAILSDLVLSNQIRAPSATSRVAYGYLNSLTKAQKQNVQNVMQHYRSHYYYSNLIVQTELIKLPNYAKNYFDTARLLMALDLNVPTASADVNSYINGVIKFTDKSIEMINLLTNQSKSIFEVVYKLLGNKERNQTIDPFVFENEIYHAPVSAVAWALNNNRALDSKQYNVSKLNGTSENYPFDYAYYTAFSEYLKKIEEGLFKAQTGISESIQMAEQKSKQDFTEKLISFFIALTAFAGIGVNNFIGAPISFFSDLLGKKLTKEKKLTDKGLGELLKVSGGASAGSAGVIAVSDRILKTPGAASVSVSDQLNDLSVENLTGDLDKYFGSLDSGVRRKIIQLKADLKGQQVKLIDRVAQLALEIGYTVYESSGHRERRFDYRWEKDFNIYLPSLVATARGVPDDKKPALYENWLKGHLDDYGVGPRFKADLIRELDRKGGDGIYGQHVVGITAIANSRIRGWTVDWFNLGADQMGWRVQQGTINF